MTVKTESRPKRAAPKEPEVELPAYSPLGEVSAKGHPYNIAELRRRMKKAGEEIRRTPESAREYLRTANLCGDNPVVEKHNP